jgi:senataxin
LFLFFSPPGTGKTKTILGIIGAFLTSSSAIPASSAPVSGVSSAAATAIESGKQVLVCAPSNAAVDELVLRLKQGVIGSHGRRIEPSVVRLGRSEAINNSVKELTLEELADRAVAEVERTAMEQPNKELREQQTQTVNRRNALRKELEGHDNNGKQLSAEEYSQKDEELRTLNRKIKELGHQLDMQRERVQSAVRKRESERRKIQSEILHKAQVICATLSGSSHTVLSSLQMKFDTVIIDEAAQCIELSALIPLKYGCKQCVMVGDPNQLPPTVLSQAAANLQYEQSLFVRMFNRFRDCVHMLNMQFRMHPAISKFPSREFYQGKLLDGPRMAELTARPWHSKLFPPYKFFDVAGGQHKQAKETRSLFNRREAQVAVEIFSNLIAYDPNLKADQIGVISPYKRQVQVIKDLFRKELGDSIVDRIDFNTIDGFQGQEKDVIILSCVRAQADAKGVGFLSDTRRMNVAITRARSSLWILGNERNLVKNPVWERLISDAKARQMFQPVEPGFMDKALKDGLNGALSPDVANNEEYKKKSEEKDDDDDEIQEIFTYTKGSQPRPPPQPTDSQATNELPNRPQKRPNEGTDLPNSKRVELSKAEPSDPRAALLGGTIPSPLPHVASPSPAVSGSSQEGSSANPTKNGVNNKNSNHNVPRPPKKHEYQQYRPNRDREKYDHYRGSATDRPSQPPRRPRDNDLSARLPGPPRKGQTRGGDYGNDRGNNNGSGAPQQHPVKKRKKKPASVFVNNRKPLPPK